MHGVDTADQYLDYYPFIRKTVKWPKKVFFYLLECCLFNSYVTFSKNNPNSRKSFLDFMSDITENLIHTSDAVSSLLSSSDKSQGSSRTTTPTPPKHAPKNDPPPPPWQAWWINKESQTGLYSTHKKWQNANTKMSSVCSKNIKKETRFLCSRCSSASRRLLHTMSHAGTLVKICSKFQVFISYSFHVIIFLLKSWKQGLWTL